MITPEMAQQELARRASQNQITPEMAQQELAKRKQQQQSVKPAQNPNAPMSLSDRVAQSSQVLPLGLSNVYRAAFEIGSDPVRSAKVTAAGALDLGEGLENIAATASNLSNPFVNQGRKVVSGKQDYKKTLGVNDKKEFDEALQSLPLLLMPELKAAEGAGVLEYLATKAGEGAIYGQASADSPGIGAALGTAGGLVGSAAAIKGSLQNAGSSVKNFVLSRISKESEKGRAFTPEETRENLQRNFTDIEGNQLTPDLGTATNNSAVSNVYKVTSRVPFSGGKDQRSALKKALREVEERNFMQQNAAKQGELEGQLNDASQLAPVIQNENVTLSQQANEAMERSRQLDSQIIPALEKDYQSANTTLNDLAPEGSIKGAKRLTQELRETFAKDKAIDKANYEAVDNFDKSLAAFSDPAAFPSYRKSFEEFSPQSESLKAIFGDDTDLGASLSKELNRGKAFIYGNPKGLSGTDASFLGKLSPEARKQALKQLKTDEIAGDSTLSALLNHARSLQRVGAAAKSAGKRTEAYALFNMASSLKKDAKNVLRESGHPEVAEQLESADQYYQSNILPYYEKPEVRKTVLYKSHSPSAVKLSKELHGENQFSILQRLNPEAQKASLNQLLTKGLGSSEGKANFDTEKIRAAYEKLPAETKLKVEQYNPGTEAYFGKLRNTKEAIESSKELSKHQLAVANASLAKIKKNEDINTKIQTIKDKLGKAAQEKEKFLTGKYRPPFKGMSEPGGLLGKDAVSSLKKSGMTALELGLLGLFPKTISAAAVPTLLFSRKANKLLTDPELLEKYLSGEKYSKLKIAPAKSRGALIRALRMANQPNQEGTADGRS
jgi:hypothetical protein